MKNLREKQIIIQTNVDYGNRNPGESFNRKTWEGSIAEAINIALAEIFEHAGGDSSAYIFARAIFNEIE